MQSSHSGSCREMGPATLVYPSYSAACPWRQTLPPFKSKQKEGIFPGSLRCLASAGGLTARPRFYLYCAPYSEKCRKYLTWKRVASASASASSDVSLQEATVGGSVAVSDAENATAIPVQDVTDGEIDVVGNGNNVVDVGDGVTGLQQSSPVEDMDQEVVNAVQSVVDGAKDLANVVQGVDDVKQQGVDADQSIINAEQSAPDTKQTIPDTGESAVGENASSSEATPSTAETAPATVESVVSENTSIGEAAPITAETAPTTVERVVSENTSSNETAPTTAETAPATSGEGTSTVTQKTKSRRTISRSNSKKNIVVSPTELVVGAQFPGKVVAIQSFGAFVDFGAFTNGLVHISRLSRSYVQKVEDVVQVGQEVKVQLLEVDFEAKRISLMLLEEAEEENQSVEPDKNGKVLTERPQQQTRTPRRDPQKRTPLQRTAVATTLKVGEIVSGFVKNMIKSGVFISLPDGTDGYLPSQEVIFKGPNTNLESQFKVGEEVTVRVLRVQSGRVNLTMRKEVNFDKINEDLNKGVMVTGTNPFELAFRKNEAIASYLAERDKLKAQAEAQVGEVREEVSAGSN